MSAFTAVSWNTWSLWLRESQIKIWPSSSTVSPVGTLRRLFSIPVRPNVMIGSPDCDWNTAIRLFPEKEKVRNQTRNGKWIDNVMITKVLYSTNYIYDNWSCICVCDVYIPESET